MMRILVLDPGHFVTTAVRAALAASDWATPVPFAEPAGAFCAATLDGIDAVFNGTTGSPAKILANARALYGALQSAKSNIRVVHLSSMTVYGSLSGEAVEGTTPLRSDIGDYGAAQVAAETLAGGYARSVTLRPGCEYGPGCPQWSERIARLLRAHRLGDLGAAGDGVCNLLYVDDLAAAVVAALKAPGIDGAQFNLAMRDPPTWNEYFVKFARALGAIPVSRLGRRRLQLEATVLAPPLKVLELLDHRLRGRSSSAPPAITSSLLNLCNQNIRLNVGKAEQRFALQWTPLDVGIRRTAASLISGA